MDLLRVNGISKTFPIEGGVFRQSVGSVQALRNVSLSLEPGDRLAVVGGSGSGKSTLAKIISGLLDADSGHVLWKGEPLEKRSRLERARMIQMIFQDPYSSLNPKLSVQTQLDEVLRLVPASTQSPADLLRMVGLTTESLGHYPFQFSGGQRQRIAIARALAMAPELLIADEPLSALDVTTQSQIVDLFVQLKQTLGLTLLFITHDLSVARQMANRVIVLQDGKIVEEGLTSKVFTTPQHAYTRALLEAVPQIP